MEFKIALNNYQNTYHYKICNILEKDDISILSNPLNLYIFSETNKFMGNIEARGILQRVYYIIILRLKVKKFIKEDCME